jgi:hypothetical protein
MAHPLLYSGCHSNPFPGEKRSILFCGNFGYGVIKGGVADIPAVALTGRTAFMNS